MQTAAALQKREKRKTPEPEASVVQKKTVPEPEEHVAKPGVPLFLQRFTAFGRTSKPDPSILKKPEANTAPVEYCRRKDEFGFKGKTLMVAPDASPLEREADVVAEKMLRGVGVGAGDDSSESGEVRLQRKSAGNDPAPEGSAQEWARSAPGQPIPNRLRRSFEPWLGDLSQVRIHANTESASAAQKIGAKAFTFGQDIFFGTGHFAPHTVEGKRLLGHELVHTRQQKEGLLCKPAEHPIQMEQGLNGNEIADYGIAYKTEGVNLRDKPGSRPDSTILVRLPFNTRMYVHSVSDGHYLVGTDEGRFGYVAVSHVKTGLPEPDAKIYHIQPGDTALSISRRHYGGEASWGADHRFFVNGLVHVNQGPGQRGIYKPDPRADWDTTDVRAGYMIWVPSLKFMRSLRGVVGSGSITYGAWERVKRAAIAVGEFLLGTGAFIVGLLHGALESVWDVLVGLKDLLVLAYDLIKWLIGLISGDSKGIFDSLKEVNWGELVQGWIDNFLAKWNHDSILKRWHFRGWVIGYVIAEILMLIFSGGIIQGIKWIGKSAKVANVVSKIPKISRIGETAKSHKLGQSFVRMLSAGKKGTMSVRAATAFVNNLLRKPASIWNKGPDEIVEALQKAGYKVTVSQSEKGSMLSKQIRIIDTPPGAPPITRIQVHPGGGRHGGSYYKISSSDPSFGTKWIADKATFKLLPGMDTSKVVWVEAKLDGWLLRAVAANAAVQRVRREIAE